MTDTHTPGSAQPPRRHAQTLREAIRTGLLRVVGEQRYAYSAEELDRMSSAVLAEVRRHSKSHPRHSSSEPADTQALLHLVDRAAGGRLLPGEAHLLRDSIRQLAEAAER